MVRMRSEEDMAMNRILTALTLAFVIATDPAFADIRHTGARPEFTAADRVIIDRNTALGALVNRDPWLVRRVLDAIAKAATKPAADEFERSTPRREPAPNPAQNPDLDNLGRSSPEAAHDLFQLIKRASNGKK